MGDVNIDTDTCRFHTDIGYADCRIDGRRFRIVYAYLFTALLLGTLASLATLEYVKNVENKYFNKN